VPVAASAPSGAAQRDPYFNPLDPGVLEDPYPAYARLRAEQPVYWHAGMGLWLVSRYADCVSVLVDHQRFTSDYRRAGVRTPPSLLSLQTLDPPEQLPVRRLLLSAIKALHLRALEAAARADAMELLRNAAPRETVDFVTEIAAPFALASAGRILGIDLQLKDYVGEAKQITDASVPALRPGLERPGLDARQRISDLLQSFYDIRTDGGILAYVRSAPATAGISRELLMNSLRVMLLAITSSTGRFFTLGLRTLLRDPVLLGQFAAARSIDRAIHELIRFDGPFQAQEKTCVRSGQIGHTQIAFGNRVVVLFGSANHDETEFPEASRILFDRSPNAHLGFGRGVHACLGTHLGLVLSRAILGVLAQNFPMIRLDGTAMLDDNPTIRGVRSMPVRFV
jgi:cytochrome P450